MESFEDREIERITYRENGKLDEIVLTGDVHIEYLQENTWMLRVGGVHLKCKDVIIDWINDDQGKVPEEQEKAELEELRLSEGNGNGND